MIEKWEVYYMKKILLIVLVVLTLFGCATEFECGWCGNNVKSRKYKYTILSNEMDICKDCYDNFKELRDLFTDK